MENTDFKVIVEYCGAWGYMSMVRIIDAAIKK